MGLEEGNLSEVLCESSVSPHPHPRTPTHPHPHPPYPPPDILPTYRHSTSALQPPLQNTESLLSINNRNLPYDCIQDTSKITHGIIHEHKYIYIIKHRGLYLVFLRENIDTVALQTGELLQL